MNNQLSPFAQKILSAWLLASPGRTWDLYESDTEDPDGAWVCHIEQTSCIGYDGDCLDDAFGRARTADDAVAFAIDSWNDARRSEAVEAAGAALYAWVLADEVGTGNTLAKIDAANWDDRIPLDALVAAAKLEPGSSYTFEHAGEEATLRRVG